jgi:hypothetical protein
MPLFLFLELERSYESARHTKTPPLPLHIDPLEEHTGNVVRWMT